MEYALNEKAELIHISQANRAGKYFCPKETCPLRGLCPLKMVIVKSETWAQEMKDNQHFPGYFARLGAKHPECEAWTPERFRKFCKKEFETQRKGGSHGEIRSAESLFWVMFRRYGRVITSEEADEIILDLRPETLALYNSEDETRVLLYLYHFESIEGWREVEDGHFVARRNRPLTGKEERAAYARQQL